MNDQGDNQIYIIDDQKSVRMMLRSILEESGYSVCGEASNAESAIEDIQTKKPDLLLVDIQLNTDMSGIELMQIVNRNGYHPSIFISSDTQTKTVDEVKQVDPMGFIPKPFTEHEVLLAVELALHKIYTPSQKFRQQLLPQVDNAILALLDGEGGIIHYSFDQQLPILDDLPKKNGEQLSLESLISIPLEQKKNYLSMVPEASYRNWQAPLNKQFKHDSDWNWHLFPCHKSEYGEWLLIGHQLNF
ncbi:MAG: response regulator [Bacteroidota bacterium]